ARGLQSAHAIFFFFQAEDGIRDGHVTGVQTCALPISSSTKASRSPSWKMGLRTKTSGMCMPPSNGSFRQYTSPGCMRSAKRPMRSEERCVGKEGRSWGSATHEKKNARDVECSCRRL